MKTQGRLCSCKHRGCVSLPVLLDQRLYGTYKGVTGKLGERAPDTTLKNLYWQHSSCINQRILVLSCYKVIFKLTEIPPRLFYANLI